jgi:flavin-dependent dehydrogenase
MVIALENKERQQIFNQYPVVIVGGGLSGLVLGKELAQRNIPHAILEASPQGKYRSIHYLTSRATAESLGIASLYATLEKKRTPISGYIRYDGTQDGLISLEELAPDANRDGFVTISVADVRSSFISSETPIRMKTSVGKLSKTDKDTWLLTTSNGEIYESPLVIDATGARAKILQISATVENSLVRNRLVRACFGGVFDYSGPENTLLFVDKFPKDDSIPTETAGWVMPLGNGKAEVVVGWEGKLKDIPIWHTPQITQLLDKYLDWFTQRGISIKKNSSTEVVSGYFAEEPLDFRRLPLDSGIIPFGEALGLNHPLNGYLIRNIKGFAAVMADQIQQRLVSGQWQPYKRLIGGSPINYGLQTVLRNEKIAGAHSEKGRSSATKDLQKFLVASLGTDGLWQAIDSGIPLGKIVKGLLSHPKYIGELYKLGKGYLQIMLKEPQYLEEIILKLTSKMRRVRRAPKME